jgi:branched-chain amino acid transport system ATP-binding protein
MLSVSGLQGGYGRSQILFDVNLAVRRGELICLLGRNGMGKFTTIHTLMGLLPTWAGKIEFAGSPIHSASADAIARSGLGLVPEGRQIFPNLSTEENLRVAERRRAGGWALDRIYALFPALQARRFASGNLLSGGEQQMLAIGRALMTNPDLLILDKATEGLAPLIRDQILDCLSQLRASGQAILIVDQNLDRLLDVADGFYVLEKGGEVAFIATI